jgi:ABC-2 type transport system permease protein
LWRVYAYLDLMWVTRDAKHFLLYYLSDAVLSLAGVTATFLLAERFAGIGSWTQPQVLFMLGYAMVVTGLLETLFSYNILWISRRLGRGQWDHTLVQPRPAWMALLTEGFMPFSGSGSLLLGVGLLAWATSRLSLAVSPAWLGLLTVNLVASSTIVLAFSFLWGSLAFWAPRAAEEISSSSLHLMYQLKAFPLDGLGTGLLGGLMTVVPVGFVAWYPCRQLLGLEGLGWGIAITPVASVCFAALAAWVFQRGMLQYGRTGSQRYLSRGFRR